MNNGLRRSSLITNIDNLKLDLGGDVITFDTYRMFTQVNLIYPLMIFSCT